jgi:hypothetical protein
MVIEGPAHVAAEAVGRQQLCRRCSTELSGRRYDVGQLVVERATGDGADHIVIHLEPISRNDEGTIYLCNEEPPAAFI